MATIKGSEHLRGSGYFISFRLVRLDWMRPIQQKRREPCLHTQSAHTEEKLLCGIGNKTTPLHHLNHIVSLTSVHYILFLLVYHWSSTTSTTIPFGAELSSVLCFFKWRLWTATESLLEALVILPPPLVPRGEPSSFTDDCMHPIDWPWTFFYGSQDLVFFSKFSTL